MTGLTLLTRGLAGHLAQPYLTLDVVSQTQQNSTNPRVGKVFGLN
jgi:hypothetical protein